jgi:putative transposase
MKYDPDKHHRRSIRLRGYDYSSAGAYFVTICAQNRMSLFGTICDGIMQMDAAGQMIAGEWQGLVERFPDIELDEYVVMPNHFHGILVINNPRRVWASTRDAPTLGDMIGAFKSITTHKYIQGVQHEEWPPLERRVWQRNYHEHVIRDEADLQHIRDYVATNPQKWELDQLHPDNPSKW